MTRSLRNALLRRPRSVARAALGCPTMRRTLARPSRRHRIEGRAAAPRPTSPVNKSLQAATIVQHSPPRLLHGSTVGLSDDRTSALYLLAKVSMRPTVFRCGCFWSWLRLQGDRRRRYGYDRINRSADRPRRSSSTCLLSRSGRGSEAGSLRIVLYDYPTTAFDRA